MKVVNQDDQPKEGQSSWLKKGPGHDVRQKPPAFATMPSNMDIPCHSVLDSGKAKKA